MKETCLDAMKIFTWQCTDANVDAMKKSGIVYAIQPLFTDADKFNKLIAKNGSLWICVDDLRKKNIIFLKR